MRLGSNHSITPIKTHNCTAKASRLSSYYYSCKYILSDAVSVWELHVE